MNALADSLASFSRTGFNIVAPIIERNVVKVGTEVGEATTGTPEFKSTLTAYGRAYNNAALRSYAIRSEVDLEENAARVEVQAGTNPEAFRSAMDAIQKAVLAEAPAEARGILAEMYTKRTGEGLARIQVNLQNELRAEDRVLVNDQISRLTEKVSFLRAQDTPEAHAQSVLEEAKLYTLLDAAEADRTITESEARLARKASEVGIIRETVLARFNNELDDPYGDPIGFIQDLKEANRTAETLSPEEEDKLANDLMAELSEHNSLAAAQEAQMIAEVNARYDAGDREATAALLSRELTQGGILERLRNDTIRPELARTLRNELQSPTAAEKSDPEVLYTVGVNLLEYTEEELATMPGLTWNDRRILTLKQRDEATGWKSKPRAKEAFDRIDRALGINPGVLRAMLSDAEQRASDTARTQLYDLVEALPPEEREAAVIRLSDEVVRTVIKNNASIQLEIAREQRQRLIEKMKKAGGYEEYNSDEKKEHDRQMSFIDNAILELELKSQN
jgi:hypothetical protein